MPRPSHLQLATDLAKAANAGARPPSDEPPSSLSSAFRLPPKRREFPSKQRDGMVMPTPTTLRGSTHLLRLALLLPLAAAQEAAPQDCFFEGMDYGGGGSTCGFADTFQIVSNVPNYQARFYTIPSPFSLHSPTGTLQAITPPPRTHTLSSLLLLDFPACPCFWTHLP